MKIKISYLPEEESAAVSAQRILQQQNPDAKLRKSDRHPPYRQIYLSVAIKNNSCKDPEGTV